MLYPFGFLSSSGFIIDTIGVSAAAYGLRKLRNGYTGSAIRVRRSSDNTESDIGFNSDGSLNTTTLTTFVGANSGYVTKWYDQSGNGKDVVQATQTNQPRIVNSGTIDTFNSKPAIVSNKTSYLTGSDIMGTSYAEFNMFAVFKETTFSNDVGEGNVAFSLNSSAGQAQAHIPWADGTIYFDSGGNSGVNRVSAAGVISLNTPFQITLTNSVASSVQSIRVNGTQVASDATGHTVTTNQIILLGNSGSQGVIGYCAEYIFFKANLNSTLKSAVESDERAFYSF